MQPTRASLAAQRQRKEKEGTNTPANLEDKVRQRRASMKNELASPLKRPSTAIATGCSSGGTFQ